jgi:hypothetical protein
MRIDKDTVWGRLRFPYLPAEGDDIEKAEVTVTALAKALSVPLAALQAAFELGYAKTVETDSGALEIEIVWPDSE